MAFETEKQRQQAFGHGYPRPNFPEPDGTIDSGDRALIWATYGEALAPGPYFISDHVARALSLLIEQFEDKELLNGLVRAVVLSHQDVENNGNDLYLYRWIDSAYGATLDILGEIVGQPREGRNDSDYREAIKTRVTINTSSGVPETVIQALRFFTQATRVLYQEPVGVPAYVQIFSNGPVLPVNLTAQMEAVSPAAVTVVVTYGPGSNWFEFGQDVDAAGNPVGPPNPEGSYFSETNYTEGGQPIGGEMVELAP